MNEPVAQFENRKRDHISLALKDENEALGQSGLERVQLVHEALPDLDFSEVQIQSLILNKIRNTPFIISSMTAGHGDSMALNILLARAAAERGWLMGVGSQRREILDSQARQEWVSVRKMAPHVALLGNLGLAQVIRCTTQQIQELVDVLEAEAMIIHLNSLQECMQPEGTPQFHGGFQKIVQLAKELTVPVVIKETGCGFSLSTLLKLKESGVAAVDVSGFGGTHWGRIEGRRSGEQSISSQVAETFANWGVSTLDSLMNAIEADAPYEVWASGGIRTGLDAAKTLALGANCVGFAKPILQSALSGEDCLHQTMKRIELELKTALFCTGSKNIETLQRQKVLKWL